jgi:hypothetical protein
MPNIRYEVILGVTLTLCLASTSSSFANGPLQGAAVECVGANLAAHVAIPRYSERVDQFLQQIAGQNAGDRILSIRDFFRQNNLSRDEKVELFRVARMIPGLDVLNPNRQSLLDSLTSSIVDGGAVASERITGLSQVIQRKSLPYNLLEVSSFYEKNLTNLSDDEKVELLRMTRAITSTARPGLDENSQIYGENLSSRIMASLMYGDASTRGVSEIVANFARTFTGEMSVNMMMKLSSFLDNNAARLSSADKVYLFHLARINGTGTRAEIMMNEYYADLQRRIIDSLINQAPVDSQRVGNLLQRISAVGDPTKVAEISRFFEMNMANLSLEEKVSLLRVLSKVRNIVEVHYLQMGFNQELSTLKDQIMSSF